MFRVRAPHASYGVRGCGAAGHFCVEINTGMVHAAMATSRSNGSPVGVCAFQAEGRKIIRCTMSHPEGGL